MIELGTFFTLCKWKVNVLYQLHNAYVLYQLHNAYVLSYYIMLMFYHVT